MVSDQGLIRSTVKKLRGLQIILEPNPIDTRELHFKDPFSGLKGQAQSYLKDIRSYTHFIQDNILSPLSQRNQYFAGG